MTDRPTIEEIAKGMVEEACDQRHEYDVQEDSICQWYEGDAYLQNTVETIKEYGYETYENWEEAQGLFFKLAEEVGLRFA